MFSTELYIEHQSGGIHSPNGFSLGNIACSGAGSLITKIQRYPHFSTFSTFSLQIISTGLIVSAWWRSMLTLEAGEGHHIIKPFSDKSLGKFASSGQSDSALPSLQMSGAARSLSVQFSGAATFKYPRRTQSILFPRRGFPCKLI